MDSIEYSEDFNNIAYTLLSSKPLKSLAHVAAKLGVSKQTVEVWRAEYTAFDEHIKNGLSVGEKKFRDLLLKAAMMQMPTSTIKAIMYLGADVYGLDVDTDTSSDVALYNMFNLPQENLDKILELGK